MKRLLSILVCWVWTLPAWGQTAPTLQFKLETNGVFTLTWPVEQIHPLAPDLLPSFQAEISTSLQDWLSSGSIISGSDFAGGSARLQFPDFSNAPVSFVRVKTMLDFSGRFLNRRVLTNAAWDNADFSGADLISANLSGSTLLNAKMRAADLRRATLQDIDVRGADLTLARLGNADCSGADFMNANLRLTELTDIDLSFARLDNADLRGAVLQSVVSSYTRFHGCLIDDLTVMDPAIRTIWEIVNNKAAGRNFNNADLTVLDLSGANLTNATFRSADLSGADLQRVDLSGADLTAANLRFTDLRGTILDARTIILAKWRVVWDIINNPRANRSHPNADLTLAFWVDVNLDHADIHGARFNPGTMFGPNLNSVNAQGANFTDVQFSGGDLRNGDFRNANFLRAQLDGVDFTGALTNGANFFGAVFHNTTMPDGSVRN